MAKTQLRSQEMHSLTGEYRGTHIDLFISSPIIVKVWINSCENPKKKTSKVQGNRVKVAKIGSEKSERASCLP